MTDVVAPPGALLTTAPSVLTLDGYKGKHIKEICGNKYDDESDNHCAHFVSHVMGFGFGTTCRTMGSGKAPGAAIRVHETFGMCPAVGAWDSLKENACLVFVTDKSNVELAKKLMVNVPKKHVGIHVGGTIWHYSNSQSKVVTQVPSEYVHHYPGAGIALFWGTFPR